MRRLKIWLYVVSVVVIIVCSVVIGMVMKEDSSNEVMLAVVSLAVALIALYISLRTFHSIDEVNAISRMDGNVMENSRYRPNILRAVFRFPQVGFSEASEALMSYMESLFKGKSGVSGARLADSVQEVADMMVLVPFFIQTSDETGSSVQLERVSRLLKTMKHNLDNFKLISDGSCKLLDETVNLIDSVFCYQKLTAKGDSDPSKLLEIRGSIFINPVSCILYNNYLGLYFLHRADALVCGYKTGLSLKQQIELAANCSFENKGLALIYVEKAINSFLKAKEEIGDDNIWRAFVCFNIARADFLCQKMGKSIGGEAVWEASIDESIRCWMTSNRMIAEHFNAKEDSACPSWLQQALVSQENKVRLTKVVFQMIQGKPLTDQNGTLWVQNYDDVVATAFFQGIPQNDPQNRTDSLVNDIRKLLEERSQNR